MLTARRCSRSALAPYRVLLTDSGVIFASNSLNAALGFLFWTIAARLFPAAEVGLGSALVAALGLLSNVGLVGLDAALVRALPQLPGARERRALIGSGVLTVAGLGFLVGLGFSLQGVLAGNTTALLRAKPFGPPGFALVCAAGAAWLVVDPLLIISDRAPYVLLENAGYAVVKLVSLAVAAALLGQAFGIVAAVGLGSAVGVAVAMRGLFPDGVPRRRELARSFGLMRGSAGYASGNYVSALIAGLPNWALPLIVSETLGARATAHFYTAWMVATLLNMAPSALGTAVFAASARARGVAAVSGRMRFAAAGAMIPAAGAVGLASVHILGIFGHGYALSGTGLLRLLVLAAVPYTLVQIGFAELRGAGRLRALLLATGSLTSLTVLGSLVLLPRLGLPGAGIAWLGGAGTAACVCLALTGRRLSPAVLTEERT